MSPVTGPLSLPSVLPVPAAPSGMAVPGPAAFPCANDAACGLSRCNVPYGKCVFPCVNAAIDCAEGAVCNKRGFCVPKPPGN